MKKLTPPEIAKAWRVSTQKIHSWIRSGELRAIDASTNRNQRPRWLVDIADLKAFEQRRSNDRSIPKRRRRDHHNDNLTEFYT